MSELHTSAYIDGSFLATYRPARTRWRWCRARHPHRRATGGRDVAPPRWGPLELTKSRWDSGCVPLTTSCPSRDQMPCCSRASHGQNATHAPTTSEDRLQCLPGSAPSHTCLRCETGHPSTKRRTGSATLVLATLSRAQHPVMIITMATMTSFI